MKTEVLFIIISIVAFGGLNENHSLHATSATVFYFSYGHLQYCTWST